MSDKLIDDIVNMLDDSVDKGCGHININVEDDKVKVEQMETGDTEIVKTVKTFGCTKCAK